jgi:hypothetical protein
VLKFLALKARIPKIMLSQIRLFFLPALTLLFLLGGAVAAKPVPPMPNIGVTGTQGEIFQPDPNRPNKFIWKIWAQSANVSTVGSAYDGVLSGVTALLFQKGVSAALLKAPTARYNSASQILVASGRVTVVSQTEPGTTLVADTITWYAKTNQIVAVGNVIYHRGKTGLTMRVPRLTADTVLKSASFGTGSATLR